MGDMRCQLLLVHLVVILTVHHSQPAAATGALLSPELTSRWCADASLEDFLESSEACQLAESLGSGVDCWASLDAVLQLCLEEAAAAGHTEPTTDKLGLSKRNRNKFLGKRAGGRNTFLGKRQAIDRLRSSLNTFLRKQLATENSEKRNRNKFLGKRTENDGFRFGFDSEKRSRNRFLGKRDYLEDSGQMTFESDEDDKRNRNSFLGKKDQMDAKRSRNKFLGKREEKRFE